MGVWSSFLLLALHSMTKLSSSFTPDTLSTHISPIHMQFWQADLFCSYNWRTMDASVIWNFEQIFWFVLGKCERGEGNSLDVLRSAALKRLNATLCNSLRYVSSQNARQTLGPHAFGLLHLGCQTCFPCAFGLQTSQKLQKLITNKHLIHNYNYWIDSAIEPQQVL